MGGNMDFSAEAPGACKVFALKVPADHTIQRVIVHVLVVPHGAIYGEPMLYSQSIMWPLPSTVLASTLCPLQFAMNRKRTKIVIDLMSQERWIRSVHAQWVKS
jgi:hypothetical protein